MNLGSSDPGRTKALKMKLRDLDFDQLINKYAAKKYSKAFEGR